MFKMCCFETNFLLNSPLILHFKQLNCSPKTTATKGSWNVAQPFLGKPDTGFFFASRHYYYYDVVVVAPPRPVALHVSRNFQYPPAPSFRLGVKLGLTKTDEINVLRAQCVSE